MTETHTTDISFASLDLAPELLQGIDQAGFSKCTAIQAETLPLALNGQDVAGQAQTGTGKTAAFLIATFHHLLKTPPPAQRAAQQPRAIILAPTRELAVQIHADAQKLAQYSDFKLGLAYGGTGYESQRKQLEEGVDILIGTPGRIIDYFKQHVFNLKAIQVMVLDEADRMFDLGFIKDIRYLLRRMPAPDQRLNMLFSATLSHRVQELAYEHMNNPRHVRIEPEQVTAQNVEEAVYYPAKEEKIPLLLGLLSHSDHHRVLVFTNTKRTAEKVEAYLKGNDFNAALISGDVPQKKRSRLLAEFSSGELDILVATDVAARGLHIPDVSHVINFDLPQDAEDYVHRIGRTARAGASGDAISLACEEFVFSLPEIEEYIGHKIPVASITPEVLASQIKPPARREKRSGSRSGGRKKSGGARKSDKRRPRRKSPPSSGH